MSAFISSLVEALADWVSSSNPQTAVGGFYSLLAEDLGSTLPTHLPSHFLLWNLPQTYYTCLETEPWADPSV